MYCFYLKLASGLRAGMSSTFLDPGYVSGTEKAEEPGAEEPGLDSLEDTLALYGLALDRRAQFLLGRGRLEEAEAGFNSAVEVSRRVHGDQHEQTLVIRNSLATVLRDTHRSEQLEVMLSKNHD